MNKRILLLCDFSKNSWQAIDYVVKVFAEWPCDFFILNIYPAEHLEVNGRYLLDPDKTFNKMAKGRSLEGLGHVLSKATFELENPRHNFNVLSRPGPFLEAVLSVINEFEMDLVALGAKGINCNFESTFGSKTLQILNNNSKSPVLVVPIMHDPLRNNDILLLADPDINIKRKQIEVLAGIATSHNATISISNPGAKAGVKSINNNWFGDLFLGAKHSYLKGNDHPISDKSAECDQRNRWAMICYMIRKPRLFSFFSFSTTFQKYMPKFTSFPILVIHEI